MAENNGSCLELGPFLSILTFVNKEIKMTTLVYPRDLRGYGSHPPKANWPGGARVALQFVINYEEEARIAYSIGDKTLRAFPLEMIGADAREGVRHMSMESFYGTVASGRMAPVQPL